jgi:hypothetical protein
MKQRLIVVALLCLFGGTGRMRSEELLRLQISPLVAPAPGFVSVRTLITASDDNRALEITAVSENFERSSTIELSGQSAPKVSTFQYSNLPSGHYEITAVLIGAGGVRATVTRTADVIRMAGTR